MRTFALFVAGFVVGTVVVNACGKKQEVVAPAAVDAGVVEVVKPSTVTPVSAPAAVAAPVVESAAPAAVAPAASSVAPAAPVTSTTPPSTTPVTPVSSPTEHR